MAFRTYCRAVQLKKDAAENTIDESSLKQRRTRLFKDLESRFSTSCASECGAVALWHSLTREWFQIWNVYSVPSGEFIVHRH